MIKKRYIVLLIVFFAFGALIEGMKKIADLSVEEQNRATLVSFRNYDLINPFYVAERIHQKILKKGRRTEDQKARSGMKISRVSPSLPEQYDSSEGHRVAEKAKPDEAAAEAKKKKKKKKKNARGLDKKNDTKKEEVVELPSPENDVDESDAEEDTTSGGDSNLVVVEPTPTTAEETKLPVTFDDWSKLVLGKPNPENVNKLVEFYNNNMVSAEVFYALLTAMMQESNPEQKGLALNAAHRTPSSGSFLFLVDILKEGAPSDDLTAQINEYLTSYEAIDRIVHLNPVLRQRLSDAFTVQVAVTLIDRSIQQFLESRDPSAELFSGSLSEASQDGETFAGESASLSSLASSSANEMTTLASTSVGNTPIEGSAPGRRPRVNPEDPNPENAARERRLANARRIYSSFAQSLEGVLAQHSGNAAITEPAQRALSRIQSLTATVADPQPND